MNDKVKGLLQNIVVPIVCIMGGVMFAVLGFIKLKNIDEFKPVTAVITRIEEEYNPSEDGDNYTCTAYAKYAVDGKTYESRLDEFDNDYTEGYKLTILYDPESPEKTVVPNKTTGYIIIGFGAILLIAGAYMFYANWKKSTAVQDDKQ